MKSIHSIEEFQKFKHGPRVIVTSLASFDNGFSRQILKDFAEQTKNEIVFIQKLQLSYESIGQKILKGEKQFKMVEHEVMGNAL